MNKFYAFAGERHDSRGGVLDCIGSFDTLALAQEAVERAEHNDWGHVAIVDDTGLSIVADWGWHGKTTDSGVTVSGWAHENIA